MDDQPSSPKRIIAGSLFALFVTLILGALEVSGIINMVLGHILMALAAAVGVWVICTEVIPSRPPRHKVFWSIALLAVFVLAGYRIFLYKKSPISSPEAKPVGSASTAPQTPPLSPAKSNEPILPIAPLATVPPNHRKTQKSPPTPKEEVPEDRQRSISPRSLAQRWFVQKVERMTVAVGGVSLTNPIEMIRNKVCSPLDYHGFRPVRMYAEGDTVYVDADLSNGTNTAIQFRRNELVVRPWNWDINQSDRALEIVDANEVVIFQYIRKRPDFIAVNGIFQMPDGKILVADEEHISFVDAFPSKSPITPIFKYPSWKYSGKYQDGSN